MDSKKWNDIKKGRFCVCEKDQLVDDMYLEIIFNIERDSDGEKEIVVTDVAKFIGKECVILPEEGVEANKQFFIDIVAEDLRKEDEYDKAIAETDRSVYGNGGLV